MDAPSRFAALLVPLVAVLATWSVYLHFADRPWSNFVLAMALYGSLPYAAAAWAGWHWRSVAIGVAGVVPAAVFDALVYREVFFAPTSSTAAIVLLFSPQVSLLLSVAGIALAHHWIVRRARRSGSAR